MHTIMWRSTLALRMIYRIIAKFYSLLMTIVLYIIENLDDNYYYAAAPVYSFLAGYLLSLDLVDFLLLF